ncbi:MULTISPECIES: IS1096 element passenger TnpR family protein [Burkholderiaceae]
MAQARKSSSRKPTLRMIRSPEFVYQLRVELLGLRPALWRQILVRGSVELSRLYVFLLMTIGWDGGDVHEYLIGDKNYGEVDPSIRPDVPDDPPLLDVATATLAVALDDRKSLQYDASDGPIPLRSATSATRLFRCHRACTLPGGICATLQRGKPHEPVEKGWYVSCCPRCPGE